MLNAIGNLNIKINVECPNCGNVINVLDCVLRDKQNYLLSLVLDGEHLGCDYFDEIVICQECEVEIEVPVVEY